MGIRSSFFLFLFGITCCIFSQQEFSISPFSSPINWPKIAHKTNVGIYIKGNDSKIQKIVQDYQANYIQKHQDWHYIRIAPSLCKNLILEKDIQDFYLPQEVGTPMNDTMRVNNRINDAHNGISPLSNSHTGNGVIIGFIDTGIDFTHDDFKHPDGSTRIISLWDQNLATAANTPQPYGYGQHWDSAGINAGLPTAHNDQWGHGTTVAGAGAGNGSAVGKYKGVAYEADMVVVEADFGANFLANVQDATTYIYNIADSLGKPCVINASAGTYFGAHDGLDPSAQFIHNSVVGTDGHLFVCSAGNVGDKFFHLRHEVSTNDTVFTLFKHNNSLDYAAYGCVPYCYGDNSVHFVAYADTSQINHLEIAMSGYHNDNLRGITNYFSIKDYLDGNLYQDAYGAYVDSIVNSNNERVGMMFMFAQTLYDSVVSFEIILSPDSSGNYYWGLHTTGNGFLDVWSDEATYSKSNMVRISDAEFPFSSTPTNYANSDSLQTICSSFQCLNSVITVGNYTNDSGYVNNLGNWKSEAGTRGEIHYNSSKGPTRHGALKPEIAASGATTVSSFPIHLYSGMSDADLAFGGKHYRNGGTSMSSPVVAGVAALYLEKCNQGNYTHFRNDLISSAYSDGWTGTLPNYDFGYGKLDGFQTLIHSGVDDTTVSTGCDSLLWNSNYYSSSGYYSVNGTNTKGCDSAHVLQLTIHQSNLVSDTRFECDSLEWIDGNTYYSNNNSATHILVNQFGCDSTINLDLTIGGNSIGDTLSISSCDNYLWNGKYYDSTGTFNDTLTAQNGCDSISTLSFTKLTSSYGDTTALNNCDSLNWNGTYFYTSGNFEDTLVNNNGCDSIVFLAATIFSSHSTNENISYCEQYTWINGQTYYSDTSGETYTLTSINGCDSVVTLNLTIHPSFDFADTISSCDQYQWNNNNYSTSGFYIDSLSSSSGCDSISSLLLTINYSFADTLSTAACNNYTWEGNSYSSSGFYQANYTTSNGCDSTLYLSLVINSSYSDTTTQAHCDNYTWNNQLYSTSGIYVDSNLNSTGCDSLNYLNLSIYPSYVDTFFKAVCDTFVWNNNTYTSSGIYTDTLASINACDSIVSYELNVNNQMGSPITLQLVLDDYCKETRWTIKDSQDSLWYEGGPYDCIPNGGGNQANDTIIQDIYIDANECYTFDLIDDFGDGMSASTYGGTDGEWLLTDYNGVTLMQGQGNFGSVISADVHIITAIPSSISMNNTQSNAIQVFPNPFSDESQIVINDPQHKIDYQIVDAQGRVVRNATSSQNSFIINKGNLSNGLYWLKILNLPNLKPVLLVIE